ncbi:MAG: hypothetical protein ACP5T0_09615, partial [Verrucomicrobiia bacterium]
MIRDRLDCAAKRYRSNVAFFLLTAQWALHSALINFGLSKMRIKNGAGDGNRTRVASLEARSPSIQSDL